MSFLPLLILSALVLPATGLPAKAGIPIQDGAKIGFLGDSITAQGAAPAGYVNMVIMGLKVEGVDAVAIPAGVSGNTSGGMRSRLGPHVLDKGANWMTLSCGVNDVRLTEEGRAGGLEEFKKNVTDIVERARAKNVQVILLTTTPLGEDLESDRNKLILPYDDFLRAYAKEKNLILADIYAAFAEDLKKPVAEGEVAGKRLLADGTHPNQRGQDLMATTILLALGVPVADLPKIQKEWMTNPQGQGVKLSAGKFALISREQCEALERMGRGQNSRAVVGELWKQAVAESGETDAAKSEIVAQGKIGGLVDAYIKAKKPAGN